MQVSTMPYLYSWLSTFDGVVNVYNSITPLRGKRKVWDIRPLEIGRAHV